MRKVGGGGEGSWFDHQCYTPLYEKENLKQAKPGQKISMWQLKTLLVICPKHNILFLPRFKMKNFWILVIVSLALALALTEAFPSGHEKSGKHEHGQGNSTRLQGGHGQGGHGGLGGQSSEESTTQPEGSTTEAPTTGFIQKRLVLDLTANYNKTAINDLVNDLLTSIFSSFI